MALGTFLAIIIIIFIAFIVIKIVWKITKIFFYIGLVILLFFLVTGFLIVRDVDDFRKNFTEKGNIVLLEEEGNIITGYVMQNNPRFLTQEEIALYSNYLQNKEFDRILEDKFKLMIININLISDLETESISLGTASIKKESVIDIFESKDPFKAFNNALAEGSDLEFDPELKDDNLRFKATLLRTLVNEELIGPENALNFFRQYKKGNLIIYPETPLFKFVNLIPINLIKSVLKSTFVKANEVTGRLVKDLL